MRGKLLSKPVITQARRADLLVEKTHHEMVLRLLHSKGLTFSQFVRDIEIALLTDYNLDRVLYGPTVRSVVEKLKEARHDI